MNIDDVVHIGCDSIEIDSGLNEQDFAHSRSGQYMSETGFLCTPEPNAPNASNDEARFRIEDFRFTGTRLGKNGTVILCAPSFADDCLLSLIQNALAAHADSAAGNNAGADLRREADALRFTAAAQKKALQAIYAASSAAEYLLKQNKNFVNCGPAGIIVSENGSVLFLPPTLFERSMLSRSGNERAFLYGSWIAPISDKSANLRFTVAACAYAIMSGKRPFEQEDEEKRAEDYLDNNFIPLAYLIAAENDKTKALLRTIDGALSCKTQYTKGGLQSARPSQSAGAAVASAKAPAFLPHDFTDLLTAASTYGKTDAAATAKKGLDEKRTAFIAQRHKTVKRRRFMRRHGVKLAVAAAAILIAAVSTVGIVKSNNRPTTENMTAMEVVRTFYSALHNLDTLTMDSCGSRAALKNYSNMAATLFVTGKMRQAYENTPSFLTPEQWVASDNPLDYWVFGLTHLTVESEDPAAYAQNAQKGDTAQITARFYILAEEGQHNYRVAAYTDRLMLEYGKKYWQITRIDSRSEDVDFDAELFVQRLASEGIRQIKDDYPWLP